MSDGVFRDDHEAAVARADALDRELARARAERDAARAEASQLRDRLLRPRAAPQPESPLLARRRRAAAPGSFAGAISVMTVGLIAAGVAMNHGTHSYGYSPPAVQLAPAPLPLVLPPAVPPSVAECVAEMRTVDQANALAVAGSWSAETCPLTVLAASYEPTRSPDSRRELTALLSAWTELRAASVVQVRADEPSIELQRAIDELNEAAMQVDVDAR